MRTINIKASKIFATPFEIDLAELRLKQKDPSHLKLVSLISRPHEISIRSENGSNKIVGKSFPGENEKGSSIKIFLSPKSEQYYEYLINFTNQNVIKMETILLSSKI